jgi:alpha-D-xyloside xylohydrolase
MCTEQQTPATYDPASYASDYSPQKSIYQDDGRMFHRGGYEYDAIESVEKAVFEHGVLSADLRLSSGKCAKLSITPLGEDCVRIRLWEGEVAFDDVSPMVPSLPAAPARARLTEDALSYQLELGSRALIIGKKPFSLKLAHSNGERIVELETERIAGQFICPPLGFRRSAQESSPFLSFRMGIDERYFGLGEKFGKVERTSTRATVWAADTCGSNTTDMSYKSVPVLFSTGGWGMMVHTSYRTFWEVGTFSYTAGSVLTQDSKLDIFVFLAPSLKELLAAYTGLTGRPAMPPKWAMGVWMSRCMYENRAQSDEVVERLRAEKIPCDVIHLDPLWMKTHWYYKIGVDACDFVRNDEDFPNLPSIFRQYADKGFATCLWINPYLPEGTPVYEEAAHKGFLLKSSKGGLARLEHGNPVGMVDFTNPQAFEWWKEHLRVCARDGAWVFKPDYGDRVPEDALFWNGRTGREQHNIYLHWFAQAAYEAIKEVRGEGIVWRRAGYIGSQRYPGTWAGDTQVSWEGMRGAMRGGLSAGLTGEAFWSHDIGGFTGPKPPLELYCRWAQFGMLSPLTRFHGTKPREPWHYGELAMTVVKRYARLRYGLMPYLLACAKQACESGVPLMRHTALEFPLEPNAATLDDQYMLGPSLLVAPVVGEGKRSRDVYFPAGRWYALEQDGVAVEGGRFHDVKAPLERMPVFVRQGAIIPRYTHNPQHLKGGLPKVLAVDVYPGAKRTSIAYVDEGVEFRFSAGCEAGSGNFSCLSLPVTLTVTFKGLRSGKVVKAAKGLALKVKAGKGAMLVIADARKGVRFEVKGKMAV